MSEPSSSCQKLNNRTGEKVKQQTPCLKIESGSSQQMPETKPVHLAPKALGKSSRWATVMEEKTHRLMKIPIESDNTILLSTLLLHCPTAYGMTYRVPQCIHNQWIVRFDDKLLPPPNGWGDNVYLCVSAGSNVMWHYDFCSCIYEKAQMQQATSYNVHHKSNPFELLLNPQNYSSKKNKKRRNIDSKANSETVNSQTEKNLNVNVNEAEKNKANKLNSESGEENQNMENKRQKTVNNTDQQSDSQLSVPKEINVGL